MLSLWRGSSSESWFSFEKMSKYRKLKNPEWRAKKNVLNDKSFYLFSADIGRLSDQTEVSIFKVNPNNNIYYATLVNIVTLGLTSETRQFCYQARDLKELIKKFNPIEVVIDTNG